ncbi:MAG: hypothetical protein AB7O52_07930 [Planctomycetota bacterium]
MFKRTLVVVLAVAGGLVASTWGGDVFRGGYSIAGAAEPEAQAGLELVIIPDAWPGRPRTMGYEYNQKSHHDAPDFIDRRGEGGPVAPMAGDRYRVVGVELTNTSAADLEVDMRFVSLGKRTRKLPVAVPARVTVVRHFAVREPADLQLTVEIVGPDGKNLLERSFDLPQDGRVSRSPSEAEAVARECDAEDAKRRSFATRPIEITVHDDLAKPVENAHLLFLLENGLMVYEGDTDANGSWRGAVVPGAYSVVALADVPDRTDYSSTTAVIQLPRYLLVAGRLGAQQQSLALTPERSIRIDLDDVDARPLPIERLWVTPAAMAPAFRYARIAQEIEGRARLASSRPVPGGAFLLLTSPGLALRIAVLGTPEDAHSVFLARDLDPNATEQRLTFDPPQLGRLILDPATGAGPARRAAAAITALAPPAPPAGTAPAPTPAIGAVRESFSVATDALHTVYLAPGSYRTELSYELQTGDAVAWCPLRTNVAPGTLIDITPRPPFRTTLYYKPKPEEKKVQFWLSVQDATGRTLVDTPTPAKIAAWHKNRPTLDQTLTSLRWEHQQKMDTIDPGHQTYRLQLPFGYDPLEFAPTAELLRAYNVEGASAFAPGALSNQVLALLPEVKRALDGCLAYLGLPEGIRLIHMEFDIFLPPGVGGLGGGGRITLDAQELLPIVDGTDPLPGPFRHELGHNLGFGHDPYMLIAPCGVDEERFSSFGYRMLHAADFQRTLGYLAETRREETTPWAPGEGVFASLRLLHGPDVHKKMFDERKASEQTLILHGLSSIERIATLYSLAVDENLAWVFRAHGWPVFDARVDLGGTAVRFLRKHPRQLNYATLEGTPIQSWWVYGPEDEQGGSSWRALEWPGRFTAVDGDANPADTRRRYLFFRRFSVPKETEVRLLCASDVQLEVSVNGTPVGFLDASPQFRQPVHDELMLDQKRPFTIPLYRGENQIEVSVSQPPGSKGFFVEWLDGDGKPVPLRLLPEGPPGAAEGVKPTRLRARNPIYNGSFEQASKLPTAWVEGASEPAGALAIRIDTKNKVQGEQSIAIDLRGAGRGGLIQRIVVEPGQKYRLRAALRTENFDGEAYVAFFTGDLHDGQRGKTEPLRLVNSPWRLCETQWLPGNTHVVYVACYVKGTRGTVGFDGLELVEVR